ncbi:MAG: hypothetical protein IE916_00800 [Epsilonproteobacteria bacterium]|nr:hypothetical protein [Campylobacterota bacterium]
MRLGFRLKHYLFSAFREIFVHHHSSLEFRAKVFALIISANRDAKVENYIIVKELATEIYKGDEDRANLLMITTKELVQKVNENNGLDIDTLVENIQRDIRNVPRFAKKIDPQSLNRFIELTHDPDTRAYQNNIVEFLTTLKRETLQSKSIEILKEEEQLAKA